MVVRGLHKKILLTSAVSAALLLSVTAWAAEATYQFDIPARPLSQALKEFSQVSGQQIIFTEDVVRGINAPPLRGSHTAPSALALLLGNSALKIERTPSGAVMVKAAETRAVAPPPNPTRTVGQPTSPAASRTEENSPIDEIVVTGTLIRGIAPAGSNVIGLSREQIDATGASNTNELLTKLPQIGNYFNGLPQPGGGVPGANAVTTINRPNLRNLPGGETSGTALTLVLIDGHRVVGSGIGTVAVDPDAIPPSALERVEAITDGGSAVYGSDAVGGVINFITRKRFDGAKAGARFGFADAYKKWDADVIGGKDWGAGSAYVSYAVSMHDAIYGRDRDYIRNVEWNPALATYLTGQDRSCDNPNVTVGARNYPLPAMTLAALPNTCDITDLATAYGKNEQHHVLAGFTQDLSDALTLDIKGFYTWRHDEANGGPVRGSVQIRSTNPYYRNLVGTPDANAAQNVFFNYSSVSGNEALLNQTTYKTWNITPSLTARLGGSGDWQLRTLLNYGESRTVYDNMELFAANQTAAAAGTTVATALNPYNISATAPSVLGGLLGRNLGIGKHTMFDARAIVDGALLSLPGGEVRVAAGAEHMIARYRQQKTDVSNFTLPVPVFYRQSVTSVFGEMQVPIVGPDNAVAGVQELRFSASGRYDNYNDFGDTFNPKLALTWRPVEWIAVTGNWGKSFAAPSPAEQLGPLTAVGRVSTGSRPNNVTYNPPLLPGQTVYTFSLTRGTVSDLKPQRANNWSVGAKIEPPFVPGLELSGSYYFIRYTDAINSPLAGVDPQPFFQQFATSLVFLDPTYAQLVAFASQVNGAQQVLEAGIPNVQAANTPGGPRVAVMYDIRARNLGIVKIGGLDLEARYTHRTSFGSIDALIGGNYQLSRKSQANPALPFTDTLLTGTPKLRLTASLGANIGDLRAQASLYQTGGYRVNRGGTLFQDEVKSFTTVNLYFRYDVKGTGLGKDLALSLNIDNLLDASPPIYRDSAARQNGIAGGSIIGRLVQFGVSKRF